MLIQNATSLLILIGVYLIHRNIIPQATRLVDSGVDCLMIISDERCTFIFLFFFFFLSLAGVITRYMRLRLGPNIHRDKKQAGAGALQRADVAFANANYLLLHNHSGVPAPERRGNADGCARGPECRA